MNISEFVKKIRKENNLTQEEVALYSGVSAKFVNELERGKETLQLNKVQQVLNLFNFELTPVQKKRDEEWE